MCGRYSLTTPSAIKAHFDVPFPDDLAPRYNIAPSQLAPIVRMQGGARELALIRWGLVPRWAKDAGRGLINARAETLTEKIAFRALASQRCLVPADGFYEWVLEGSRRRPIWFHRTDRTLFAFAGLWDRWREAESGTALETFTIVTTRPNNLISVFHHRMPVIIAPEEYDHWLDSTVPLPTELLVPYPSGPLEFVRVSTHVNSPRHDDAHCIKPEDI